MVDGIQFIDGENIVSEDVDAPIELAQAQIEPLVDLGDDTPVELPDVLTPDINNVIFLPEGISLAEFEFQIDGADLLMVKADGTVIRILGGAASIPTFQIGEIVLPQEVVALALGESNINVAAGSAVPTSPLGSGGDFDSANNNGGPDNAGQNNLQGTNELLGDSENRGENSANAGVGSEDQSTNFNPVANNIDLATDFGVTFDDDATNVFGNDGGDGDVADETAFTGPIGTLFTTRDLFSSFVFDVIALEALGIQTVREDGIFPSVEDITLTQISGVTGTTLTAIGASSGNTVFEFIVNPDGSFTFNLLAPLAHGTSSATEETLTLTFPFTVADNNGDSDDGTLTFAVNDDTPVADNVSAAMEENPAGGSTTIALIEGEGPDLGLGEDYIKGADGGAVSTVTLGTPTYSNVPAGVTPGTPLINLTATATGYDVNITPGTAFDALAQGESLLMTIPYTVEDGDGDKVTKEIQVTVNGTNDVPVITNADTEIAGTVVEAGHADDGTAVAGTPSISGQLSASDVDTGATETWSIEGTPSTTYGSLAITDTVTGAWTYTLDNTDADTQALAENAVVKETYTVRVTDDFGAYVDQTVTITINGTNDAPILTGDLAANVDEGGSVVLTAADLGFTDVDDDAAGMTFAVTDLSNGAVRVGGADVTSFTGTQLATGAVSFVHDGSETIAAGFNVSVDDGNEDSSTPAASVFSLTVTPVNDVASIIGDKTATVTEDTANSSGKLTDFGKATVTDPDAGESSFIATSGSTNRGGTYSIDVNGNWTYSIDNSLSYIQSLGSGDVATSDGFLIQSADGTYSSVRAYAYGVNDAPTFGGTSTGEVNEGLYNSTLTTTGVLTISDPDTGQSVFQAETLTNSGHGQLVIDTAGAWTYTVASHVLTTLNDDQNFIDSFSVRGVDGTSTNVNITVNGYNENSYLSFAEYNSTTTPDPFTSYGGLNFSATGSSFPGVAPSVGGYYGSTINVALAKTVIITAPTGSFDYYGAWIQGGSSWALTTNLRFEGYKNDVSQGTYDFAPSSTGHTWAGGNSYLHGIDELRVTATGAYSNNGVSNTGYWYMADLYIIPHFTHDPIVLDLNGDGVDLSATTAFDIDADGDLDQIGWTGPDDGVLVVDLDSSGAIEDGSELFSEVFNGGSYANSLEALRSLDSNGDGVIDAQDAAYNDILVWQDANSDGVSQAGELQTLAERGIVSLDLDAAAANQSVDGNTIFAEGTFTKVDGSTGSYVGVDFAQQELQRRATNQDNMLVALGAVATLALRANDLVAAEAASLQIIGQPDYGTVVVNDDMSVSYTSDGVFEGNDSFVYEVTDLEGNVYAETVNVIVGSVDVIEAAADSSDAPVIVPTLGDSNDGSTPEELAALVGGEEGEVFIGTDGDDVFIGGAGDDVFIGGNGADTYTGGDGADTFVIDISAFAEAGMADMITDYEGEDTIDLGALLEDALGGPVSEALAQGHVELQSDGANTDVVVNSGSDDVTVVKLQGIHTAINVLYSDLDIAIIE